MQSRYFQFYMLASESASKSEEGALQILILNSTR